MAEAVTAIAQAYPLSLSIDPLEVTVKKGQSARVKVHFERSEQVALPLEITTVHPPKQVTVRTVKIEPDKGQAEIEIKVGGGAAPGTYGVLFVGTAKVEKAQIRAYSPLLLLKVEPRSPH